jgi:electron-transferring-flavoprotein dehydrogenase
MTDRDVMEYDVAIVGGGPAGLACAIRLKQLDPERSVCLLEKGSEIGAHTLSGAVIEPAPLDALLPGWRENPPGICVPAGKDEFLLLTRRRATKLPTPPQMKNHGNFIVSLGQLNARLAEHAESLGVDVFPGFAGAEAILEDDRVIGVRCGDMGLAADGSEGPAYTPGVDIHAGCSVFAEGCRGSVSKQLIRRFALDRDRSPQTYGLGFKELWQLPAGRTTPGLIQHTIGWPLDSRTYGGSFLYHLDEDRVYVGFVVGLDYEDPLFSPFEAFQQYKHHPAIASLLAGGEIVAAGARTIIEGGIQSLPRLEMPGAMLIGDGAGTLNVPKIKGVHMALDCGMLAAAHIAERGTAEGFDALWHASASARELQRVRNIRPGFRRGLWFGLANAGWETLTGGRSPWTLQNHADHETLRRVGKAERAAVESTWQAERSLPPRDRLASVYFAATAHEESQPVHLQVADTDLCATTCYEEYRNPCTRFCPAQVYEMVEEEGSRRLQINASNCVHCKACDIKDPYAQINWVTPEGGSGPNYQSL